MDPPQTCSSAGGGGGGGGKRKARRRGSRRRRGDNSEPHKMKLTSSPPPPLQPPNPKRRKGDAAPGSANKTSSFLDKMRNRLSGGHFRMLNEKLYTCSGKEAFSFFKDDPELFDVPKCLFRYALVDGYLILDSGLSKSRLECDKYETRLLPATEKDGGE